MSFMSDLEQELMSLAQAVVASVTPTLLQAYLDKKAGVAGAPAITLGNVGNIVGTVAAATVLQHINATTAAATATATGGYTTA